MGGASRLKDLLHVDTFHTMLTLERRRAERSRKPFVLMLLDAQALFTNGVSDKLLRQLTNAVSSSTRETDLVGWYKQGGVVGVIFTEVNLDEKTPITQLLLTKIVKSLHSHLDLQLASKVIVTLHLYPENWTDGSTTADTKLYPEIVQKDPRKRLSLFVKRTIDIAGSGLLLLLLSPLLALISAAIKMTSEGSVLFEQDRLGQFGQRFKCLKFRTMYSKTIPRSIGSTSKVLSPAKRKKATLRTARFTRSRTTLASRPWDECYASSVWTSCLNSGMSLWARCRWWGRALRLATSSNCMTSGTAGGFSN